jgi:hypothetical protein
MSTPTLGLAVPPPQVPAQAEINEVVVIPGSASVRKRQPNATIAIEVNIIFKQKFRCVGDYICLYIFILGVFFFSRQNSWYIFTNF